MNKHNNPLHYNIYNEDITTIIQDVNSLTYEELEEFKKYLSFENDRRRNDPKIRYLYDRIVRLN